MRAGKIRYWGLSNFTGWQLAKAVRLARALNATGPVTVQPQYSLLARGSSTRLTAPAPATWPRSCAPAARRTPCRS